MPDPGMQAYEQGLEQQRMAMERRKLVSKLLSDYLNYTPNELDLKKHSRKVVEEAFIKGASVWWHELVQPAGSKIKLAGSFFDTIDNLVWDPDADEFEDIRWCARKREDANYIVYVPADGFANLNNLKPALGLL